MSGCKRFLVLVMSLGFLFFGCVGVPRNLGERNTGKGDPQSYGMPEFPQKDLGEFSEKVSEAHKTELIRENLKEKYVSGVSYPFEFVYYHQYSAIRKDGSTVEYADYAIRVHTADALKRMGEQIFPFHASKEVLEILNASVHYSDGREIQTDPSSARAKDPFTGLVYSDLKVKSLSLTGLDIGSVLRIKTKRMDRPGGRENPIFEDIGLTNYLPAREKVYVLRFQAGTEYLKKERIRGEVSGRVVAKSWGAEDGDTLHIYAVRGGGPEIPEPGSIPAQEFDDRVFFYTPATWDEVARRYYSLSIPKVAVTGDVSQKASLLSKDLVGREEKIKAIYDYVKGVRYVAILLNQHEIIPHEASLTLKNGYGDCKDKSVLLMAMLKAVGIESSIALVNTTHLVDRDLASLSIFDHAIVALREKNGTYTFLDATGPYVPYGLLPLFIQYRHALVVGEKGGELVTIAPQPAEKNQVDETTEVSLHDLESATLATKSVTISSNEGFHMLPGFPEAVLRQLALQALSEKHKEVEIMTLRVDPPDKYGVLRIETKVKIKDFTKKTGDSHAFKALMDADPIGRHDIVSAAERKTDIELDGPKRFVANVTITIPESVGVEFIPQSTAFKNDKFGEYSYQIRQTDNTIRLRREFRMVAKRISVKDYAEFREFYRKCMRQDEEMVLIRKR